MSSRKFFVVSWVPTSTHTVVLVLPENIPHRNSIVRDKPFGILFILFCLSHHYCMKSLSNSPVTNDHLEDDPQLLLKYREICFDLYKERKSDKSLTKRFSFCYPFVLICHTYSPNSVDRPTCFMEDSTKQKEAHVNSYLLVLLNWVNHQQFARSAKLKEKEAPKKKTTRREIWRGGNAKNFIFERARPFCKQLFRWKILKYMGTLHVAVRDLRCVAVRLWE